MKSNIIWICGRTLPIWNEETFLCFKSIFWDIILHLPSLLERTKGLSQCGQETEEYLGALNSRSAQKKNKTGRVSNQEIKSSLGELTTLARLSWIYRHWWRFTFFNLLTLHLTPASIATQTHPQVHLCTLDYAPRKPNSSLSSYLPAESRQVVNVFQMGSGCLSSLAS